VGGDGISEVILVVAAPLHHREVPALCSRTERLLRNGDITLVTCDVAAIDTPDLASLDAVARLALTARRVGATIQFVNACPGLSELIDQAGLTDVVRLTGRPQGSS
jgi:ABC-type transporter Mla MlaB component